jgi:hypothetical protein
MDQSVLILNDPVQIPVDVEILEQELIEDAKCPFHYRTRFDSSISI